MNTIDLPELLRAIEALPPRTLTAKMRAIYPAIEAKRSEGIQHAAILAALNAAGWNMSMATYKSVLARIRRSGDATAKTPILKIQTPVRSSSPTPQAPSDTYLTREERDRRADEIMQKIESRPQPSILERAKR